jgi:hypothetical protein
VIDVTGGSDDHAAQAFMSQNSRAGSVAPSPM